LSWAITLPVATLNAALVMQLVQLF
jgi:hypothetical protein